MDNFQEGDKVLLDPGSIYRNQGTNEGFGFIVDVYDPYAEGDCTLSEEYRYQVEFEQGYINQYRDCDLVLVERPKSYKDSKVLKNLL